MENIFCIIQFNIENFILRNGKGAKAVTGYVRAYKPEMKIKHYEAYRGIYCSLCRVLGKRYGIIARLTLSYDFTFFAILRMCVQSLPPCFEKKSCPFNPAKKCNFCSENGQELEYTADAAMLTVYYKILDNIHDDSFFRRLLMRMILPVFRRYYKKAKKYAPEADKIIAASIEAQAELEKSKNGNSDLAADSSAKALSELLSFGFEGSEKRILGRIGYLLGRWVYLTDAYFDREEDLKKGGYNPFLIEEKDEKEIKEMLNLTVGEMINTYELLNVRQFDSIIRNVLFDGLHYSIETNGGKKK